MLGKFRKTIEQHHMIENGDTVIAAVSGGVDSVVLLHLLAEISSEYKITVIAAHLNHCLRGRESERDELFVRRLCESLRLQYVVKKIDTAEVKKKGESLQDAARNLRYAFFEEAACCFHADRIATGHNMDDQAETVVMRFLKGTGLSGLSGMAPVRGKYIRPLIDISRKEIEEYADAGEVRFVRDSSNIKTKYLRNKIRLKLIPLLEEYNPAIKKDTARLAGILAKDEDCLCGMAESAYKKIIVDQKENALAVDLKKLKRLHDAIKARVFFMAIERLCGSTKGFYSCHVEDFLGLLSSRLPNIFIDLPKGLRVYKEYDAVSIVKNQEPEAAGRKKSEEIIFESELALNSTTVVKADNGLLVAQFNVELQNRRPHYEFFVRHSKNVAYFDCDKLKKPLIARGFRQGDRFVPFGMKGSKKLKDLFIEKKIARRSRPFIPIITSGAEIIWVAGIRQSEYGKIEAQTERVLKIEIKLTG